MELNSAAMAGFKTRFDSLFNQAFNLAQPQWSKAAYRFDGSGVEFVNHRWLRGIPQFREFLGARVVNNLNTDGLVVRNKKWEDTFAIPREVFERDQYKTYDPSVQRLGEIGALFPDKLVFELMSDALADFKVGGSAYLAYDGVEFFGTHSVNRKVPFVNAVTGAGTVLNYANLLAAIADLRKRKDTEGNPLAAATAKVMLIVPPDLYQVAATLANASFFPATQPNSGVSSATSQAAATENILKGSFEWFDTPYLKTSTEWYVIGGGSPIFRPVIWQEEVPLQIYGWDKFIARWVEHDEITYGGYIRGNVSLALPELVYASTGAA